MIAFVSESTRLVLPKIVGLPFTASQYCFGKVLPVRNFPASILCMWIETGTSRVTGDSDIITQTTEHLLDGNAELFWLGWCNAIFSGMFINNYRHQCKWKCLHTRSYWPVYFRSKDDGSWDRTTYKLLSLSSTSTIVDDKVELEFSACFLQCFASIAHI